MVEFLLSYDQLITGVLRYFLLSSMCAFKRILDESFIFRRAIHCLRYLQEDWSVHSACAVYSSLQEVYRRRFPIHQGAGQRELWKSKFINSFVFANLSVPNRSFSFRAIDTH